jgi:5-formyltetrahydrofolate cyclo-ligase
MSVTRLDTWDDVRRWRRATREELIAARLGADRSTRASWQRAITAELRPHVRQLQPRVVGFYWPFKGEYDPRPLVRDLVATGGRAALPVVIEKGRPLIFREWRPGTRMQAGIWNIPVPADGPAVVPDTLLIPLVGFDGAKYRLGYGGGYYDRTLAALPMRPWSIGIGFALSRLATIHPQPHDIAMDKIVTPEGWA